jgi:hypothetical protein
LRNFIFQSSDELFVPFSLMKPMLTAGISIMSRYAKPNQASPPRASATMFKIHTNPVATRKPWAKVFSAPTIPLAPQKTPKQLILINLYSKSQMLTQLLDGNTVINKQTNDRQAKHNEQDDYAKTEKKDCTHCT